MADRDFIRSTLERLKRGETLGADEDIRMRSEVTELRREVEQAKKPGYIESITRAVTDPIEANKKEGQGVLQKAWTYAMSPVRAGLAAIAPPLQWFGDIPKKAVAASQDYPSMASGIAGGLQEALVPDSLKKPLGLPAPRTEEELRELAFKAKESDNPLVAMTGHLSAGMRTPREMFELGAGPVTGAEPFAGLLERGAKKWEEAENPAADLAFAGGMAEVPFLSRIPGAPVRGYRAARAGETPMQVLREAWSPTQAKAADAVRKAVAEGKVAEEAAVAKAIADRERLQRAGRDRDLLDQTAAQAGEARALSDLDRRIDTAQAAEEAAIAAKQPQYESAGVSPEDIITKTDQLRAAGVTDQQLADIFAAIEKEPQPRLVDVLRYQLAEEQARAKQTPLGPAIPAGPGNTPPASARRFTMMEQALRDARSSDVARQAAEVRARTEMITGNKPPMLGKGAIQLGPGDAAEARLARGNVGAERLAHPDEMHPSQRAELAANVDALLGTEKRIARGNVGAERLAHPDEMASGWRELIAKGIVHPDDVEALQLGNQAFSEAVPSPDTFANDFARGLQTFAESPEAQKAAGKLKFGSRDKPSSPIGVLREAMRAPAADPEPSPAAPAPAPQAIRPPVYPPAVAPEIARPAAPQPPMPPATTKTGQGLFGGFAPATDPRVVQLMQAIARAPKGVDIGPAQKVLDGIKAGKLDPEFAEKAIAFLQGKAAPAPASGAGVAPGRFAGIMDEPSPPTSSAPDRPQPTTSGRFTGIAAELAEPPKAPATPIAAMTPEPEALPTALKKLVERGDETTEPLTLSQGKAALEAARSQGALTHEYRADIASAVFRGPDDGKGVNELAKDLRPPSKPTTKSGGPITPEDASFLSGGQREKLPLPNHVRQELQRTRGNQAAQMDLIAKEIVALLQRHRAVGGTSFTTRGLIEKFVQAGAHPRDVRGALRQLRAQGAVDLHRTDLSETVLRQQEGFDPAMEMWENDPSADGGRAFNVAVSLKEPRLGGPFGNPRELPPGHPLMQPATPLQAMMGALPENAPPLDLSKPMARFGGFTREGKFVEGPQAPDPRVGGTQATPTPAPGKQPKKGRAALWSVQEAAEALRRHGGPLIPHAEEFTGAVKPEIREHDALVMLRNYVLNTDGRLRIIETGDVAAADKLMREFDASPLAKVLKGIPRDQRIKMGKFAFGDMGVTDLPPELHNAFRAVATEYERLHGQVKPRLEAKGIPFGHREDYAPTQISRGKIADFDDLAPVLNEDLGANATLGDPIERAKVVNKSRRRGGRQEVEPDPHPLPDGVSPEISETRDPFDATNWAMMMDVASGRKLLQLDGTANLNAAEGINRLANLIRGKNIDGSDPAQPRARLTNEDRLAIMRKMSGAQGVALSPAAAQVFPFFAGAKAKIESLSTPKGKPIVPVSFSIEDFKSANLMGVLENRIHRFMNETHIRPALEEAINKLPQGLPASTYNYIRNFYDDLMRRPEWLTRKVKERLDLSMGGLNDAIDDYVSRMTQGKRNAPHLDFATLDEGVRKLQMSVYAARIGFNAKTIAMQTLQPFTTALPAIMEDFHKGFIRNRAGQPLEDVAGPGSRMTVQNPVGLGDIATAYANAFMKASALKLPVWKGAIDMSNPVIQELRKNLILDPTGISGYAEAAQAATKTAGSALARAQDAVMRPSSWVENHTRATVYFWNKELFQKANPSASAAEAERFASQRTLQTMRRFGPGYRAPFKRNLAFRRGTMFSGFSTAWMQRFMDAVEKYGDKRRGHEIAWLLAAQSLNAAIFMGGAAALTAGNYKEAAKRTALNTLPNAPGVQGVMDAISDQGYTSALPAHLMAVAEPVSSLLKGEPWSATKEVFGGLVPMGTQVSRGLGAIAEGVPEVGGAGYATSTPLRALFGSGMAGRAQTPGQRYNELWTRLTTGQPLSDSDMQDFTDLHIRVQQLKQERDMKRAEKQMLGAGSGR